MEEDHSFLFLKKNLMKIFFFFGKLEFFKGIEKFEKKISFSFSFFLFFFFFFFEKFGNFEFFQGIENFD